MPVSVHRESCSGVLLPHMTLTRLFSQDGAVRARHLACAVVHRSDHGRNTVFIGGASCFVDMTVYILDVDVDVGLYFPT